MKRYYAVFIILFIFFWGCDSSENNTPKKIVVTNWVGYTPLLYAYENGDLDKFNIEIIVTSSLQSSYKILKRNLYDGMTLTQKEHQLINNEKIKNEQYIPIALFDRSYGGDAIVSNFTAQQLKNSSEDILVLLEKDTINTLIFDYFKKLPPYKNKNYKIINMNQDNILNSDYCTQVEKPVLIVTYEPYLSQLIHKNFHIIESTKNDKISVFDYLVVKDRLFTNTEIKEIQTILHKSVHQLQNNPKEYFDVIKIYLDDTSYDDFQAIVKNILFIDNSNKKEMLEIIKSRNIFKQTAYLEQ